jgi:hypothetical protein
VLGLEADDAFIPAKNLVLKLRGFSYFRGDINNWIGLLKEYLSYVHIHNKIPGVGEPFLGVGPLLLTCEKLDLPSDTAEANRLVGIFLEEIPSDQQHKIITCRARFLTDFWNPKKVMRKACVSMAATEHQIPVSSLRKQLRKLALQLWKLGLSIDYCDLSFFLDQDGSIVETRIFDFERVNFGELVNENHIVLDTLIDLKSRLRKDDWDTLVENSYRKLEYRAGFETLPQSYAFLRSKGRRRSLALKIVRWLQHAMSSIE